MRVALFATCLVDLFRPNVGFAAARLLEDAGCDVVVPAGQTCCGQPAYNSGDFDTAREIAGDVLALLDGYSHVVVPSGSCSGMVKRHYPSLFEAGGALHAEAVDLAGRCHELTAFLVDVLKMEGPGARYDGRVTYHDSCSSLREHGIKDQPRRLLGQVAGLSLVELADAEACCGFGGTFSVKFPDISGHIVNDKVKAVEATGADTLVSADLGCLLNLAGRVRRVGSPVRVYHIAEVLAGMTGIPGIGGDRSP